MEVEKVPYDDLGTCGGQRSGAVVLPVHEGTYSVSSCQQQVRGLLARGACCAGDEEEAVILCGHCGVPSERHGCRGRWYGRESAGNQESA
jgi:hypothetical protein